MFSNKISTATLAFAALRPLVIKPISAASDWWIIGFQTHFCRDANIGDTSYNWRGSDSECHNFGQYADGCIYETVEADTTSAVGCTGGDEFPGTIRSLSYLYSEDNESKRCVYFDDANCGGESEIVKNRDMTAGCYEFDRLKRSFRCHSTGVDPSNPDRNPQAPEE